LYAIENQLIFPLLSLCVPQKYTAQISAVPTTARTVGQTLTLCITSMAFQMGYDKLKPNQDDTTAFGNAIRICLGMFLFMHISAMLIIMLRTGQLKSEAGKKGFTLTKVR